VLDVLENLDKAKAGLNTSKGFMEHHLSRRKLPADNNWTSLEIRRFAMRFERVDRTKREPFVKLPKNPAIFQFLS
jgi:hypothetical protein